MALRIHSEKYYKRITRRALVARFPLAFFPKGQLKRPLKVNTFRDLRLACPDISYLRIKLALSDYCGGPSYHAAMTEGAVRIDLNGEPAGTVSKAEAAHAAEVFASFPEHIRLKWGAPSVGG
jgi:ProP effector